MSPLNHGQSLGDVNPYSTVTWDEDAPKITGTLFYDSLVCSIMTDYLSHTSWIESYGNHLSFNRL